MSITLDPRGDCAILKTRSETIRVAPPSQGGRWVSVSPVVPIRVTASPLTSCVGVVVPGDRGAPGPPGADGRDGGGFLEPFEYLMPVAQTTATFGHTLGRDPTAIQVFVDGALCDEYSVGFPLPSVLQLGFDVSVQALIRII